MSDAAINPYQSGNFESMEAPAGPARRPTGLLIFCVLILTMASMGLIGSLFGGVMMAVNGGKVDYKQQFGSQPNVELHPDALAKLRLFEGSHAMRNIVMTVVSLIVASLLIFGAVAAIYPMRSGATILTIACAAAILFLIAQGVVVMMTVGEVSSIVDQHPDDFFVAAENGDAQAAQFMVTALHWTYKILPIFTWIFNGLKCVFYLAAILYLRKSNVQAFLRGASA